MDFFLFFLFLFFWLGINGCSGRLLLIFCGFILYFFYLIRVKFEFAVFDNVKYYFMEMLCRMIIFVIGILGVLILVLMEGDYWIVILSYGKNVRYIMDIEFL